MASEPWIDDIVSVLHRAIGLDPSSIGVEALHHSIRAAREASGVADPAAFVAAVQHDPRQRQALIERVVVPETWFLRDHVPFELLVRHAWQWLGSHGVLRVLSAPCASGEEAYSIAIALLDAGISPARFAVDAVDVSEPLLERARLGLYHESSMRKCPPEVRERHFSPVTGGVQVSEAVRSRVTFTRCNLVDGSGRLPSPRYDVVFCRNLMIYLHPPARQALRRILDGGLAPDGLLIVGHAEVLPMCEGGSFAVADSRAFALVRATAAATVPRPAAPIQEAPLQHPWPQPVPQRPAPRAAAAGAALEDRDAAAFAPAQAARPAGAPASDLLEHARRLADQGRLVEARRICERVIAERGPSDGVLFLIGVIDQAAGRLRESAEALRKVLYLNPSHRDALMQLAVVLDRQGDRTGADRLRRRAARLDEGRTP